MNQPRTKFDEADDTELDVEKTRQVRIVDFLVKRVLMSRIWRM